MKRGFFTGFLTLATMCGSLVTTAQQFVTDFNIFWSPETGPYVELYTNVSGHSLTHGGLTMDSLYQDKVQITYIFKNGEEVVSFKKKMVEGQKTNGSFFPDILDQQRVPVPEGDYELEVEVVDMNSSAMIPYSSFGAVSIEAPSDEVWISDIQLAEGILRAEEEGPLTKSGYDLIPLVVHYYPQDFDRFAYYFEIYNTEKVIGEKFLIKQYIKNVETGDEIPTHTRYSKESSDVVVVNLNAIMIDGLASGKYEYIVEVRNRDNELLASNSVDFERSNPMANLNPTEIAELDVNGTFVTEIEEDSLDYWISSTRPLASQKEAKVIDRTLEDQDFAFKQKFFYTFWANRSSDDPAREWEEYKDQIYKTNRLFGTTVKEGFETDRGRIYLKYGAPNSIADRPNEPSTYPYQIWHYYKIGRFNNKRFIFYQPDLVTNDYELLHTDLQGERQNYRWKAMLNNRNTPFGDIDNGSEGNFNHWGGNSSEFYTLPR